MFGKLARETAIYGIAQSIGAALAFLTLSVLTRVIAINTYGIIALITTYTAMLPLIFGLSLDTSITRYYQDESYPENILLQVIAKWYIIYGVIILSSFCLVASAWSIATQQSANQLILIILLVIGGFLGQIVLFYQTLARMRHEALSYLFISVTGSLVSAVCTIVLVLMEPSVLNYFLGWFLGIIAALLTATLIVRVDLKHIWAVPLEKIRKLLNFALPLLPAAGAMYINNVIDRWAIAAFLSSSEVAIYSIGAKVASLASLGIAILTFAFLPHSMRLIQIANEHSDELLERSLRYFACLTACGVIVLQGVSPYLIAILAPQAYVAANEIVGILALSAIFFGYTYFSTLGSWKTGHSSDYSIAITCGVVANVCLNVILIPFYGINGAAYATAAGMLVTSGLSFVFSYKRNKIGFSYNRLVAINIILLTYLITYKKVNQAYQVSTRINLLLISTFALCSVLMVSLKAPDMHKVKRLVLKYFL